MVKAEVKTPNKRKSLATNTPKIKVDKDSPPKKIKLENDTPAKKVKLENGKTPTPQKQNSSPKTKQPGPQSNKKQKQQPNPAANGAGPKPFKGTKQLDNNQKKNKKDGPKPQKDTVQKQKGPLNVSEKKKKRKNLFSKLFTEVKAKQGSKDPELLASINQRVKDINSRGNLTKTAKKKLSILNKLRLICEEGSDVAAEKSRIQRAKELEDVRKARAAKKSLKKAAKTETTESKKNPAQVKPEPQGKQQPKQTQGKQQPKKVGVAAQDSDEDDDDDDEEEDDDAEEEDDAVDSEGEEEDSDDDEGEEDDDEEDDDDEDDDESEEEAPAPKEKPTEKNMSNKSVKLEELKNKDIIKKGQKRFVLFVGNIPYDATKEDLTTHFSKVGNIIHIRIPTEKGSNRPRGFAYVEVDNETAYEKCLSMHHSHLKSRRINVLYTQGGKKKGDDKKKEIKAKNFKLHALRQQGKLAGSVKQSQKRSFRRNKSRNKN